MIYVIIEKYYSAEDKLFHIIKKKADSYDSEYVDETFTSFDLFYKATKKDLSNADLLDYDFANENLKKYNFSQAKISSQIMLKLGVYDKKIERVLKKDADYLSALLVTSQDLVPCRNNGEISVMSEEFDKDDLFILYISDLHINHKLIKKFISEVNEYELTRYLEEIILKMKNTIPQFALNKKILIVGDISFNFLVFKKFFVIYKKHIFSETFVVLGNHELWDKSLIKKCGSIEKMIDEYRMFLEEINIELLENQLYIPIAKKNIVRNRTFFTSQIYSEKEIIDMSNEDLRKIFSHNGYAILGGIGYAGLNQNFNCNHGIYRSANITREEEIARSKRFEALHKKLSLVVPDKKLFIVSHMPKTDWTNDDYVKNWVYISGHTHKNYYLENEYILLYSDNQIGYDNSSFGFKYLTTSTHYNLFSDYSDGIHKISREEYQLFYRGLGESLNFNREFNALFLIKRNNSFCFLMEGINKKIYLLNGGQIKNVGHDLKYFYEKLPNYANSVKLFLQSYSDYQKEISTVVKKIGGSGYIHGCIVDIDFYNHLYINPLDGIITPYFAYSITEKYVYKNLISLLKEHCKNLYLAYKNMFLLSNEDSEVSHSLIFLKNDIIESKETVYVESTEMYKISRIIKGLQYTTKYNVVRLWNDVMADKCSTENGKLIVKGIIYPESIEKLPIPKVPKIKTKKEIAPLSKEDKQKAVLDRYIAKIQPEINQKIEVINYEMSNKKATYKCLLCGNVWEIRPDHFKERQHYKCPICKSIKH